MYIRHTFFQFSCWDALVRRKLKDQSLFYITLIVLKLLYTWLGCCSQTVDSDDNLSRLCLDDASDDKSYCCHKCYPDASLPYNRLVGQYRKVSQLASTDKYICYLIYQYCNMFLTCTKELMMVKSIKTLKHNFGYR